MGNVRRIFIEISLIVALGFFVYSNSLGAEFIWDDHHLVENNLYIRNWLCLAKIFSQDLGAGSGNIYSYYRPLQLVSYLAEYSLWGLNAVGYHLVNILLHILVVLAFYYLSFVIFCRRSLAYLAALLFLVHPVNSETVSYISNRADLLSALFIFIAVICYIKRLQQGKAWFYFLSVFSFTLAIFSKESALIFPILLIIYHFYSREKIKPRLFMPFLAACAVYLAVRSLSKACPMPDFLTYNLDKRIASFFAAITNYLTILFLPFGLHAQYPKATFGFCHPKVLAGLFFSLCLIVYAVRKRKSNGLVFFSIAWFYVCLLPFSNIYPTLAFYMAEHFLYLPAAGFFILLAAFFSRLRERLRVVAAILIVMTVFFYSYLCHRQNNYWGNEIQFYLRTLEFWPGDHAICNNLCKAYVDKSQSQQAVAWCKKAIEAKPDFAPAYYNLGCAWYNLGQYRRALVAYSRAAGLSPLWVDAYNGMGNSYTALGNYKDAMLEYQRALELDPISRQTQANLKKAARLLEEEKPR